MKTTHFSFFTLKSSLRIRRVAPLLLIAALVMNCGLAKVSAQNKTMYIYRNDGGFDAFLNEDVDSVVYTTVDDSLTYDQVAVQEIWTKNGVTRIPVDAIDSVSFKTPEPVFRENVFHLTRDILSYVTNATQTELTFKSSTPASKLPVQGQVVISDYLNEPVTGGFAGKVISITRSGSDWVVTCGYVSFDEIFERVALVGKTVLCDEESPAAKRYAPKRDSNQDLKWWEIADTGGSFIINNLGTPSLKLGEYVTIKDKEPIYLFNWSLYINYGYYKFSLDVESVHDISLEFEFKKDFAEYEKKWDGDELFGKKEKVTIKDMLDDLAQVQKDTGGQDAPWTAHFRNNGLIYAVPIVPGIIAGVRIFPYVEFTGSVYLKAELPVTVVSSNGFTVSGITTNPMMAVFVPHNSSAKKAIGLFSQDLASKIPDNSENFIDVRFDEAKGSVGLKGSLDAGLGVSLFFNAGGFLLQGAVTAKAGLSLSGDANLSTDIFVGADGQGAGGNWNLYQGLADTKVSLDGSISVEPKLEILTIDAGNIIKVAKEKFLGELPDFKWKSKPWEILKAYLFPAFTAPAVMRSDFTQPTGVLFSSTVTRNIIIPGQVGLRVNNEFGSRIKEEYYEKYHAENTNNPRIMTMDISDLTPGDYYTITPMFKWSDNFSIYAWPPTTFQMPQPLALATPELIVAVDETLRTNIVGGWGDYTVKSNDETIATCIVKKETKNGKDYYYVDVTGKKRDETDIILTDKVSREQFTQHVIVTPKDQGSGNIGDMPGIEL